MITLKERVENLLNQKYVGNLLFFKNAVSKFSSSLVNIKTSYKSVYTALVTVQNQEEPQKSSARNLTNSMRDYIFSSLTFCTEYTEYIPNPSTEFKNLFLRSTVIEFLSRQDNLCSDIKAVFDETTEMCLKMSAKYQGIRAQSMKSSKGLLDLVNFPNFCDIEEDIQNLHDNLEKGKLLIDDLYLMYFKFIDNSSVFMTEKADPVVELESIAATMREELDECEKLFVKKTSLFKVLYNRLDENEKLEFQRQLTAEKRHEEEEEEEEEEESQDALSRCLIY